MVKHDFEFQNPDSIAKLKCRNKLVKYKTEF
jgi:hypothetical protein